MINCCDQLLTLSPAEQGGDLHDLGQVGVEAPATRLMGRIEQGGAAPGGRWGGQAQLQPNDLGIEALLLGKPEERKPIAATFAVEAQPVAPVRAEGACHAA